MPDKKASSAYQPGSICKPRNRSDLWTTTALATFIAASAFGVLVADMNSASAQEIQNNLLQFNIQSQPLSSAAGIYGRQSGLQVSLAASSATGVTVNAVSGKLAPLDALSKMLSGTGVTWRVTGDNVVVVTNGDTIGSIDGTDGEVLDTIVVYGGAANGNGFRETPDWVYDDPSSVSVISQDAIQETGARDARRLFDGVAGAYSGDGSGSFPTVSPNIRGLQDSGRVIVSIDGARQNAQDGGRYGGGTSGGMGMAMVDTSFVREIDIQKKTEAAANNAGSLGGSADFRLVGVNDIIQSGRDWGMEANVAGGTNAYDFDGSAIGAVRISDALSLTMGVSRKSMGQYEPGENGVVDGRYDVTNQNNWSAFAKLEAELGDVSASLSWLHQQNQFSYDTTLGGFGSQFDAGIDTIVADLGWMPDTPLVDLNGKFWINTSLIDETRDARGNTPETYIDKELTSFGIILDNTSDFGTRLGDVSLNYGVEAFRDIGDKGANSSSITDNPLYESSYGVYSPRGRRDVASAFLNAALEPADWVTLSGGLRYDWSRLKGRPTYYDNDEITYIVKSVITEYDYRVQRDGQAAVDAAPPFLQNIWRNRSGEVIDGDFERAGTTLTTNSRDDRTLEIDRSDGAWLPSATLELKPVDWFHPYASYSQSYRPPTLTEAFIAGNIAPGDLIGTSLAPNEWLRPEKARTYEVGANITADQLFTDNDRLRMKISAFYREVDDYIVFGSIIASGEPDRTYNSFVNLDGTARMRGIEVEGNYDAGAFWLGASSTYLNVDWPQKTETFSNGTTSTDGNILAWNTSVPPRFKLMLDAGFRLFDERLAVGARVNHVTPTLTATLDIEGNVVESSDPYTTMDLYGSYKVNDNALLRLSVNNVTDINYIPATGAYQAPGRTLQASLKLRF
ncbi:TonB-dependent receptor [Roseibium algae]|uniref:TonB-dependent receptor n=1 Tax=Roseibium algae TaxID=3123038 RepID=A0ABU8TFA2_9HYPH